jgi:hypothetical protein
LCVLDTDNPHRAEPGKVGEDRLVAGESGGEAGVGESSASAVDDRHVVGVSVRIDPSHDLAGVVLAGDFGSAPTRNAIPA